MTPTRKITDPAASVRQRLLNRAREQKANFNLLLQQYAAERFLYRLGLSSEVDRFTLKGASLFIVWTGRELRPTRDIDLLSVGAAREDEVRQAMEAICAVPCPEDGIKFDESSIRIDEIRKELAYAGLRTRLRAQLGQARIPLQVDIGFGDTIYPERVEDEYPTLLDLPAPRLWMYPREACIAEKFEAMLQYGLANSRMKDFWDVAELARLFTFDGATLQAAIGETVRRRNTPAAAGFPEALRPAFYADIERAGQWRAFQEKVGTEAGNMMDFAAVGEMVRDFLGPIWRGLQSGAPFLQTWQPGGPWRPGGGLETGESGG